MIIGVPNGLHNVCGAYRLESVNGRGNRSAGCQQSHRRANTGAKRFFHRDLLGYGREDLLPLSRGPSCRRHHVPSYRHRRAASYRRRGASCHRRHAASCRRHRAASCLRRCRAASYRHHQPRRAVRPLRLKIVTNKSSAVAIDFLDQLERFIKRVCDLIAVTALQSLLNARRINFDSEKHCAIHRCGEWLRAAHASEAAGQNKLSFKRTAKMFPASGGKGFECTLHDSLAADVNPRAGRHLAVHRQAQALEAIKLGVIVPLSDEI